MAKTRGPSTRSRSTKPSSDDRAKLIAEGAYYLAEQRGFAPGHELEDWLAAESAVDARLAAPGKA
jgi:hypothetical protein